MDNMMKTVLITGTSSGIGSATALHFSEKGWNVIATMRSPQGRSTPLHARGLPDLVHLDVMDVSSIQAALQYALDKYGKIDVLVNNAGYAVYGPFEATTLQQAARQFDTNVFGLMAVTREALPIFRKQKEGTIINVASMGGRIGFPLYSLYNSTKFAVEGFTEAIQYELRPLNIKVKLIEPGVIKTDFYERSMDATDAATLADTYGAILKRGEKFTSKEAAERTGAEPDLVAKVIYQAATDESTRLRYIAGADAKQVWLLRRIVPESIFFRILEKVVLG
ncbi:MAG: SDR family oxidoreductase [Smithellaceae bacterium]|nr:SDR family oxidoreductase [Smithellaceae bacterium]